MTRNFILQMAVGAALAASPLAARADHCASGGEWAGPGLAGHGCAAGATPSAPAGGRAAPAQVQQF